MRSGLVPACVVLACSGWAAVAWAEAPEASSAKVAVVVAGDPDEAVRKPAARLDALVGRHSKLRTPADPGLRRALRGEGASAEDDGLERVRAERRRLGLGEGRDLDVLARLGRMAGADLVLVVRDGETGPEAVGFDVRAGAFYEDALSLADLDDDAIHAFAYPRAKSAAHNRGADTPPPPPPPAADPPAQEATAERASPPPTEAEAEPAAPEEGEEPAEKPWIGRNWPYLVAGALLAASVVFMVVRDTDDDPGPPVLRFSLGSDP